MNNIIIDAYHATDKKNEENIIKFGYDLNKCKNEKEQWLGKGIYFWTSIYYAIEWNYIYTYGYSKNVKLKNILNKKTIFIAEIFLEDGKVIDLSSPEGHILFEEFQNIIIQNLNEEEKKEIIDADDAFWIYLMNKKGFLDKFDVIIATYPKRIKQQYNKKSPRNFQSYNQTQICVKDTKNIISNNIYRNSDSIKFYFEYIYNNRKK